MTHRYCCPFDRDSDSFVDEPDIVVLDDSLAIFRMQKELA